MNLRKFRASIVVRERESWFEIWGLVCLGFYNGAEREKEWNKRDLFTFHFVDGDFFGAQSYREEGFAFVVWKD